MIGRCPVCPEKDSIIADLRARIDSLERRLLALVDAKAYALVYPPEKKPAPVVKLEDFQATTPERLRARMYEPEMTADEIEEQFKLRQDLDKQIGRDGGVSEESLIE